jgi:hypothetical protein
LTNSRHKRLWWKLKPTWRSKPCNLTMGENLNPNFFMTICVNVESNNKQVHFTHHNNMELRNKPLKPSWNVLNASFVHKDLTWTFELMK